MKNHLILLSAFTPGKSYQSSDIANFSPALSLVSIKRHLSLLWKSGYLERTGAGRSVSYTLNQKGLYLREFDMNLYSTLPPEAKGASPSYNFGVFGPLTFPLFSDAEKVILDEATELFEKNATGTSLLIHKKELERFIIELSWKSSRIEGNTYTLLDTEFLLREGTRSDKNTESEAAMIINHKNAFTYIYQNLSLWNALTVTKIEDVHRLLTDDLGIERGLRKRPVGVTGTVYRPLDNHFQIKEALESLCEFCNQLDSAYEKALMLVLGISYIQPFEDGNKRTARLMGNSVLLVRALAPLSYRTVDEKKYREAALLFYEQNSITAMKEIFIEQYVFSAGNYNIG